MNIVEDIIKYKSPLIKYMDQVVIYDSDFKLLDRYRGVYEMAKLFGISGRQFAIIKSTMFKKHELERLEYKDDNYIVYCLRRYLMQHYLENKGR